MKAMTLRLEETEYERLRTLAFVGDRAMNAAFRPILPTVSERLTFFQWSQAFSFKTCLTWTNPAPLNLTPSPQ